jgi:hypothetical protein
MTIPSLKVPIGAGEYIITTADQIASSIERPFKALSTGCLLRPGCQVPAMPLVTPRASGFRKLAAGRIDAVYSNRDRGRQIIGEEGLSEGVGYAGGHQGILY